MKLNCLMKYTILFTVFITPLFFITSFFYPFVFTKSLLLESATLVLAILFLIKSIWNKDGEEITVSRNLVFASFLIYLFFIIVSALHGLVPELSFWGSMDHGTGIVFIVSLFIFSIITSSVFNKIEDWYELFSVLVFSGIIFSIGSLMAQTGTKFTKLLSLTTSGEFTLGNSSYSGIFLVFVFFISLGLALSAPKKSQKILGYAGLIIAFFNPIVTGFIILTPGTPPLLGLARSSAIALYVGLGIFVLYAIYRKISSVKWKKIFLGFWLAFAAIGIISIFVFQTQVKQEIAKTAGPNRIIFWDIAVKAFKERPILGWGDDTYHLIYTKYFNPVITSPGYSPEYWVDRSHNIYFDRLASGGIMGILSLFLLYGVLFYGLLKKAIKEDKDKVGFMYASLFVAFITFLLGGVMIFQVVIGWFLVALLISFTANFCFKNTKFFKGNLSIKSRGGREFALTALIVVFSFLFYFLIIGPASISRDLANFSIMPYQERMAVYDRLGDAYMGNTTEFGNAFYPYQAKILRILSGGIRIDNVEPLKSEMLKIGALLESASKKEKYLDLRVLVSSVGVNSILAVISDGAEKEQYHNAGMFYINKMIENSTENPIINASKEVLDSAHSTNLELSGSN